MTKNLSRGRTLPVVKRYNVDKNVKDVKNEKKSNLSH